MPSDTVKPGYISKPDSTKYPHNSPGHNSNIGYGKPREPSTDASNSSSGSSNPYTKPSSGDTFMGKK
ncbi:Uu.00g112270.m01.CDS01 [Anthostomella pinea]|uniref:Uu.00g112270.m01.CDS01 n=1 Tax=Anthostomella pinea TaxID=933095 RepID=A0AAI8VF58_9PEZI|nr:Uu.00g112270.m01.CDS01 [Anthostomella pinea]